MSVHLNAIQKRFGQVVAVDTVSLEIPSGSFFSIIGASGCGKTTTLRLIAGFETPDAGTVEVDGEDVTRLAAYRRPVNTVFQSYALFPHLDVFENVAFGLREARRPKAEIRERAGDLIRLVQLSGREHAKPRQLSGGQQQRVALARALVNRPKVLLLDEPLGALDLKLRREMQLELKEIQRSLGITFVYVTHDQDEAFGMSDTVAVMNAGRLDQVGAPEDVYSRPATEFVADFVGAANRFAGRIADCLPGGRYQVEFDAGGVFSCEGRPDAVHRGDSVTVIVRPEDITVSPSSDAPASDGLTGTITDASFLGAHRSLTIAVEGGYSLSALVQGRSAGLDPGDRVDFTWDEDAAWVVGQTGSGALAPQLVDR